MKGVTTNLIEIILIIIGLAIVAFFVMYFGSSASNKTTSVLSLMNALKGGA